MTVELTIECQPLIAGNASGQLLVSTVGLSFWGGVDPVSGNIIDQYHSLYGQNVSGKVLVMPSGRGSCTGSGVMLEALLNDVAPAALVFSEAEDILTLGVFVGEVLFERAIPVYRITSSDLEKIHGRELRCKSEGGELDVSLTDGVFELALRQQAMVPPVEEQSIFQGASTELPLPELTVPDRKMLDGTDGKAAQLAMQIVLRMAALQGATSLVDVSQAHIDACVYNGPSSLLFAQRLVALGGKVKVPTTLNSLSVDKRRWQQQGVQDKFGEAASALGDAYIAMGATPSYTCAPYLLESAPAFGDQIVWAESNAVTYANSVIGARTQKYPDFLDICIALTGRAPMTGAHLDSGRQPQMEIHIVVESHRGDGSDAKAPRTDEHKQAILSALLDDSFWPLLGYHIGGISRNNIPLITGLESLQPTQDDHKAFSAAFATTSSVAIYHIAGHTPESQIAQETIGKSPDAECITIDATDLAQRWQTINSAGSTHVELVCFGNPHFSLTECAALVELCRGKTRHPSVGMMVTLGRSTYEQAMSAGYIEFLSQFGVQFVNDTCWCMIEEPLIPVGAKVLMTNSAKYAHYGPGLVNRSVVFGSMAACVRASCTGVADLTLPSWLKVQDVGRREG